MKNFIFCLLTSGLFFSCNRFNESEYIVYVTYTNGQQDILTIRSIHPPRTGSNGCVFTGNDKSYICGVRKINVIKQENKQPQQGLKNIDLNFK